MPANFVFQLTTEQQTRVLDLVEEFLREARARGDKFVDYSTTPETTVRPAEILRLAANAKYIEVKIGERLWLVPKK